MAGRWSRAGDFFVLGVGERGVGAGVCGRTMAARWGLGVKEDREVSPQSGIAMGIDGEREREGAREVKMEKEKKQERLRC